MGYDMYRVAPLGAEDQRRLDEAQAASREAIAVRDALPKGSGTVAWSQKMLDRGPLPAHWTERYDQPGEILVGTPEWVAAQRRVLELREARQAADLSYFRLNISGMSRYRDWMAELGMVHEQCWDSQPPWPDEKDYGLDEYPDGEKKVDEVWYGHRERPDLFTEQELAFLRANDEKLAWSPEVPGIPAWKLGSNDGWHVTPMDIKGALHKLEEAGATARRSDCVVCGVLDEACTDHAGTLLLVPDFIPEASRAYWALWLRFLAACAADGDGFRVH